MGYVEGTNRYQTRLMNFDEYIGKESIVRVIDRFVEAIDLTKMGFDGMEPAATGRPGYDPKVMTKLYIYGYENGIRSSRKLERETHRNVEVMWLMDGLKPDHKTIAEFRRQNIRPMQKLFREFVHLCKTWDLVGGEVIAIDGTKIKASNNKKNNFSRKKIDERIKNIDEQIERYLTETEETDRREGKEKDSIPKDIEELLKRKELYEGYLAQIEESGANEISKVDPDARLMGNNRGGVDMAYNVQSAVDGKNDIIVACDVSQNAADHGQLATMVKKVKRTLKLRHFTALADKGYYNGEDLARVKKYKVKAIVARQNGSDRKGQPEEFHNDKFIYNSEQDTYTCPMGQTLHPHNKKTAKRRNFYNKAACAQCPHRADCCGGECGYRTVARNQYARIYEETDRRTKENQALYKRRQQIVEHPFGTVKHTMQGYYFLLRTRRKVRAEVALLFLGYNLKRACKVLGFREIMARLDSLTRCFFVFLMRISCLSRKMPLLKISSRS